jgi:tetratricopeptide (TPR) repeat protein
LETSNPPQSESKQKTSKPRCQVSRGEIYLVAVVLLLAFLIRCYYATQIEFENEDEVAKFTLAQGISFHPDNFYVPVGSEKLFHPPLNQYLIKMGLLLGGENPFAARLPFLLLGTLSLLFVYLLAREGLGKRGALFALVLVSFDQYLIQMSILMIERVYISFLPPAMYLFYRGLGTGKRKYFLFLGVVLGLGYLGKESILLLLPGFGLFMLFNARFRPYLFRPHIYITLLITVMIILPNLLWNVTHGAPSFERHVMKIQDFGFVPRAIALYLGELIIASLDKAYLFLNSGHRIWSEAQVTPHWVVGIVCLIGTIMALKEWKKPFFQLLLLLFFTVVTGVSFLSPHEDLNNFWWASASYVPALIMAAHLLNQISRAGKSGFFLVALFLFYVVFRGWGFVNYPDPCSRYLSTEMEQLCRINRANRSDNHAKAEELCRQLLGGKPKSDMGHLFLGETYFYQERYDEAEENYQAAYNLNPKNAMVPYFRARVFVAKDQLENAAGEMYKALNLDLKNYTLHYHLAIIYNAMGNVDGAIEEMERAITLKSDKWENYGFLAVLYFHKGEYAQARRWINRFRKFHPTHPEALDMDKRLTAAGH